MKNFLPLITLLALSACSSEETGTLNQKITERDSCLALIDELGERVKALNLEIADLDTSLQANKRKVYVSTMELTEDTFTHFLEVQGIVEAEKNILIHPETAGLVQGILVEEGQTVAKGQVLIRLDNDAMHKSLDEIKVQFKLAEDLFKRQENLWRDKIGSEVQYLEARTRKESLEKSMQSLQARLDQSVIRAPESGWIDEIIPKVGEMASPMMPVLRMVNLDRVYLKGDVSESYLSKVKTGQQVDVLFPSINETRKAKIVNTGNFINPGNRTFKIKVDIGNPEGMLKPNLLGIIRVQDFVKANAIAIPSEHVLSSSSGEQYVYLSGKEADKTFARRVTVKASIAFNGKTLIEEGLKAGDHLITLGARTVTDGETVIVKN